MNTELLGSSIDTLKSIRSELHSNLEDSVLKMLDEAISDLEYFQQSSDQISAHDVLYILGQILEKLPMIVELIHILSNAMK